MDRVLELASLIDRPRGESFSPGIHVKTRRQTFPCLFAKQLAQAVLRNEVEEILTVGQASVIVSHPRVFTDDRAPAFA